MRAPTRSLICIIAGGLLAMGCRDNKPPTDRPYDSPGDPVAGGKFSQIAESHGPLVDPELDQRLSLIEARMRTLEGASGIDSPEPLDDDDILARVEALEERVAELDQIAATGGEPIDRATMALRTAAMLEDLARELRLDARFQAERALQDEPSDGVTRRRPLHDLHLEQPPLEPPPSAGAEPDEPEGDVIEDNRDF